MKINGNQIEAIIFDLGGVILNIDIEGTFSKFKDLGLGFGEKALELIKNNDVFIRFEIGEISPDQFRNELRKVSKYSFSMQEFDKVWNSMILDYPQENIHFLEKVKPNYRTFLMSNTNQIHFEYYSNTLFQNFGYQYLDELFEKAYYSHTSGMRKPNADFFLHILNENNLKAQNTLFIDDFAENIEAAKQLGLNTFHLINGSKISDLILH
jgi:putative hydrolase of the HAD superfamily